MVTSKIFVEAWQTSSNVKEVEAKLPELTKHQICFRAEHYAIAGFALKILEDFNPFSRIVTKDKQSWFK